MSALIDVTIDVRDLRPDGPVPAGAFVTFSRLIPTESSGKLISSAPVKTTIDTSGHGLIKLESSQPYTVRCYNLRGFTAAFSIMTGTTSTSLGALWRTSQINPGDFDSHPVPQTLADLLAASVPVALTQAAYEALAVKNPATLYLITT